MWEIFEKEIIRKSQRILAKHRREHLASQKHTKRFTKRTNLPSTTSPIKPPSYWTYDNHFDPIYCIKHARHIAKGIWKRIVDDTYEPRPAIQFSIDKPGGGFREIMVFAIPDSAIANIFHRRLTARNKGLFSAYSFAYRADKTIFEAILHLQRMIQPSKTYVLQYDYSKYFDTIDHLYLERLLRDTNFVVTTAERNVIKKFLRHRFLPVTSWQTRKWITRDKGVPQGSSLSLFLSNFAAHELDMQLERLNGSFVRFADDALAVAHSYSDARNIELEFHQHCIRTGVKINFDKSSGITLMSGRRSDDTRTFFLDRDDGNDLKSTQHIDFLGHRVSADNIDLTSKAVKRIKRRIIRLIYIHLLQYPRNGHPINPVRVGSGFLDWDLITCINELRRYIYGGLRQRDLTNFIDDNIKLRYVRGLLAFYPLVSTPKTLKMLDGWLVNVLSRAIRERNRLITSQGLPTYSIGKKQLIDGSWHVSPIPGAPNEVHLPSFVLGWRAARKFYKRYGLAEIEAPSYYSAMSLYT